MTTSQQSFTFAPLPKAPARRNVVIEAGAGTGKTTAIVAEVLKLLLENEELAPERIVLVTFTEKAAGEIAERIHQALSDVDAGCAAWPPGSPRPLYEVSDAARRACEIQLARIDNLRSQTIHSFCQMLLRQFPIEAGLDPQFRIVEGFERSMLYGDVYDAWIDAETRLNPNPEHVAQWELLLGHAGYLFQIRAAVLALLDRRDLLQDETLDAGDVAEFEDALQEAVDEVRANGDDDSRITRYVRENAQRPRGLDAWIDYLAPIANDIRTEKLGKKNSRDAMKMLRWGDIGDSAYDRLVSHRAAVALLALARRFIAFLDEEKRKLGVVDFDDLLLRTAALLDHDDVLARVRRQFDYVFVDEFQDTDRVQARILERLGHGTTIVVGDPKQSIYGFRRADPETYGAFTRRLVDGGAEHGVIRDQYRSDTALLNAFNSMFSALFANAARDPNVFRPAYHPLIAAKSGEPRDAHITFLHGGENSLAEAEQIAEWIAARGGELRRYAILLRRTAKLDDYLDALQRYGIAYVLPPTRLFLDRPAAVDLVAVLRAIAYAFDRGAEVSAARSPYYALTDDEIVAGGAAMDAVRASLAALREASRHLTVARLIEHVLATTNIEAVYAASADGDRALRHLEHLRAIAFTYDRRIGGSVRQFVDEIAQRRRDPEEMEPSLLDDSSDAVRIMTVHAAKGLEFDTVILPDLSFAVRPQEIYAVESPRSLVMRGQFETLSAWRDAGGRTLRDIGRAREEAELHRLFYVAVTRAKSEVVFVCGDGKSGFAKCLHDLFGPIDFPEEGREVRTLRDIQVAVERVRRAGVPAGRRRRRLADASLEAELAAADPVEVVVPMPPSVVDPRTPAEIAITRNRARNRPLGIAVHRVLERWDGVAPLDPLVTSIAREQDIDERALRARVVALRSSNTFQRIAAAETLGREVPIRFLQNGEPQERRIDRWIREHDADIVVDYKSGQPQERDIEQVHAYCEALAQITGRKTTGLLWYIDEDRAIEL